VNSGIMDQFAVAMGKKDRVILLDCNSLDYEYLPFEIAPYSLVIINTNKQRSLADSKYNERHAECQSALKIFQKEMNIEQLCDIRPFEFDQHRQLLKDSILLKRARHVVLENARVNDAAIALQSKDLVVLGKLMYASHDSLRDDYEVSCKELDFIVDFCGEYKQCIGARMTGAGFGGCAIALVHQNRVEDFSKLLAASYKDAMELEAEIFSTSAAEGVRQTNIR
jgi:galactokinase